MRDITVAFLLGLLVGAALFAALIPSPFRMAERTCEGFESRAEYEGCKELMYNRGRG